MSDRLHLSIHGTLQATEVLYGPSVSPYKLTLGTKTIRPSKIRILWIKIAD
jgi:hypothetical protein